MINADLGYLFVADFRYQLIRESLIFATFSAVGIGVGLYMGWLILYLFIYFQNLGCNTITAKQQNTQYNICIHGCYRTNVSTRTLHQ